MFIKLMSLLALVSGSLIFSLGTWLSYHDIKNWAYLNLKGIEVVYEVAILLFVLSIGLSLMLLGSKHLF